MRATTVAALGGLPAVFIAGGLVASRFTRGALASAPIGAALPAEVLRTVHERVVPFGILLAAIALAWFIARAIVRDADAVPRGVLAFAMAATGIAACCWPVVFSADVHAYAAYGIELLHGFNPYAQAVAGHGSVVALPGMEAQLHAWSESIPRDDYGPLFTALAALAAATGAPVTVLRIAGVLGTAGCVLAWHRGDARGAAAFATHPVILWAMIEGHNDGLALLPVLLGLRVVRRGRGTWFVVAALMKAFALLPLLDAVAPRRYRLTAALRAPAILAVWALLPHREAWYAGWLVAAALHARTSPARTGLLVAAYCGLAAYLPEVFLGPRGATFQDHPAFAGSILMMQYALPLAAVLAVAAFARPIGTLAQTIPLPAAAPSPSATPATSPAPSPTPTGTPSPSPSPTPAATATPSLYHYVVVPPPPAPGNPAILEIALRDQVVHTNAPFNVRITTSTDVTRVVLETYGQQLALTYAAPGRFTLDTTVPNAPFFLIGMTFTVTATALTADGRATSFGVDVRLER